MVAPALPFISQRMQYLSIKTYNHTTIYIRMYYSSQITTAHCAPHTPHTLFIHPLHLASMLRAVRLLGRGVQLVVVPRGDAHLAEQAALPLDELEGRRELSGAALVHDQHVVVVGDGVQPVRNADHRAVAQLLAHRFLWVKKYWNYLVR